MSGPFRELFVELTRQAFEIAKGIGERAVHEAEQRARPKVAPVWPGPMTRLLATFERGPGERYLANRYGWEEFTISRSALTDVLEVRARLHCGHRLRLLPIDERIIWLADRGSMLDTLVDEIDKRVDAAELCYCVRRHR